MSTCLAPLAGTSTSVFMFWSVMVKLCTDMYVLSSLVAMLVSLFNSLRSASVREMVMKGALQVTDDPPVRVYWSETAEDPD